MNRNQYNYYQSIIKNGVVGDTRTLLLRVVMIMDENSLKERFFIHNHDNSNFLNYEP